MVNKKFFLGILVMVLVFGMTVVGNLEAQTDNGGELIITDIPAKYNGKYAHITFIIEDRELMDLSSSEDGSKLKTYPIIDGKVIFPLWDSDDGVKFERYSGNDTVAVIIEIVEKEKYDDRKQKLLETFSFSESKNFIIPINDRVKFSNGNATKSYKNRSKR